QAVGGIRDGTVPGVQTGALPMSVEAARAGRAHVRAAGDQRRARRARISRRRARRRGVVVVGRYWTIRAEVSKRRKFEYFAVHWRSEERRVGKERSHECTPYIGNT